MTELTNHRHAPTVDRNLPPAPADPPVPVAQRPHQPLRGPAGAVRMVLAAFALAILLLLVFVLQNGQRSDVYFLGAHGHLPTGVALVLAAVFGALLMAVPVVVGLARSRLMAVRHGRGIAAAARKGSGA